MVWIFCYSVDSFRQYSHTLNRLVFSHQKLGDLMEACTPVTPVNARNAPGPSQDSHTGLASIFLMVCGIFGLKIQCANRWFLKVLWTLHYKHCHSNKHIAILFGATNDAKTTHFTFNFNTSALEEPNRYAKIMGNTL